MKINKKWERQVVENLSIENNIQRLKKENVLNVLRNKECINGDDFNFNVNVKESNCDFQNNTDYCWMYAGINILKNILENEYGIKNVNINYSYLQFYDKLERINKSMLTLIKYKDKKSDSIEVKEALKFFDNGWLVNLKFLLDKYGLIISNKEQKGVFSTQNSSTLNWLISSILIEFNESIRKLNSLTDIDKYYKDSIKKIYELLVIFYGKQPKTFTYRDENYNLMDITPRSFYRRYLKDKMDRLIMIGNEPNLEYNKCFYEIQKKKLFTNDEKQVYLNLELENFQDYIIKALKDNNLIYVEINTQGCGDLREGIFSDNLYELNKLGFNIAFDKDRALKYGMKRGNHASCIAGVDIVNNKVVKWKLKDSKASISKNKGYFILSNEYFINHVYTAFIDKKYLNDLEIRKYDHSLNQKKYKK